MPLLSQISRDKFPVDPTQRDHSCVCSVFRVQHAGSRCRIPRLKLRHHVPLRHVKMKASLATAKPQSSSGALCVWVDSVRHPKLSFRFSGGAKRMDVSISGTSRRTKCHWDPHYKELPWGRCHRISASVCLSSRQISWGGKVRHTHRYSEHSCLLWGCKEPPETRGGRCKKKSEKGKGRGGKKLFF